MFRRIDTTCIMMKIFASILISHTCLFLKYLAGRVIQFVLFSILCYLLDFLGRPQLTVKSPMSYEQVSTSLVSAMRRNTSTCWFVLVQFIPHPIQLSYIAIVLQSSSPRLVLQSWLTELAPSPSMCELMLWVKPDQPVLTLLHACTSVYDHLALPTLVCPQSQLLC